MTIEANRSVVVHFLNDETAISAVEYALVFSIIVAVGIIVLLALRKAI